MKILIIGGTVFLGRHLVEAALARAHEVTLFNRGQRHPELFPEVERLRGDRTGEMEALRGRRWDAVIDTCGYVPGVVRASAELLAGSVEHYTFISSISVYGDATGSVIDESTPVNILTEKQVRDAALIKPAGPIIAANYGEMYGGLKALCERAAEEEMDGRVLNVRAGLIVGPHDYSDRFTYWPTRLSRGGEVLAPGQPLSLKQMIDVRDLSEWIVRMIEMRGTGTFNATGPDHELTMEGVLDECCRAIGSDARLTWVSDDFLLEAGVAPWTEMPLWMPAKYSLPAFSRTNCEKAIAAGLTFRPLAQTARETLAWDTTRPANSERLAGLQADKESQLLQLWHKDSKDKMQG
ncbi:MAG TPA: SDR family oxidoreductase [Pyrinomonadaceae bacterium]|jgi:2'-hydroxyisoflavone reductase|nr:SDR family oxidoreductase [Pyrinomonadaceae bacterium]